MSEEIPTITLTRIKRKATYEGESFEDNSITVKANTIDAAHKTLKELQIDERGQSES